MLKLFIETEEESEDYENIKDIYLDPETSTASAVTRESDDEDHDYEDVYNIYENVEDLKRDESKPTLSSGLVQPLYEEYKEEFRIVLLGKTGAGKSATGNSLLGKTVFESKLGTASITRTCARSESHCYGRNVVVVDTPGLFDTRLSVVQIDEHIVSCVHLCFPGPHVFLLVLQIGRFTQEEISSLNQLFDIIGDSMRKCSILLFTGLDNLEREGQKIEDFVENGGDQLNKFISNCGGRYFAINNIDNEQDKKNAVQNLFEIEIV